MIIIETHKDYMEIRDTMTKKRRRIEYDDYGNWLNGGIIYSEAYINGEFIERKKPDIKLIALRETTFNKILMRILEDIRAKAYSTNEMEIYQKTSFLIDLLMTRI